jgi:hypothetical protein
MSLLFGYIPAPQQVESAKTVLRQTGQQVMSSTECLFSMPDRCGRWCLTFKQGQEEVISVVF